MNALLWPTRSILLGNPVSPPSNFPSPPPLLCCPIDLSPLLLGSSTKKPTLLFLLGALGEFLGRVEEKKAAAASHLVHLAFLLALH